MTHRQKPEQNLSCNISGGESSTVGTTISPEDDLSLASIISTDETLPLEYQNWDTMLEDHLRLCSNVLYSKIDWGRFTFHRDVLQIHISIRRDTKAIDFSCAIYNTANNLKRNNKPVSYSLMTIMMKYKAIFQQRTKMQQSIGIRQIGTWNGKFLYIQSLPLEILQAQKYSYFALELERFCAMAKEMNKDFVWTECRTTK